MSGRDESILHRIEEQGREAPRVALAGSTRSGEGEKRYAVLGEVARGGVGVVHRGHDNDLGRDVALKVLHEEHLTSKDLVQRFVEEAQIGGQLQHPGIVPVYELSLMADRRPFFAMKLVKGETLAARLARRADASHDRRGLLTVFREVCRTVAYAHSRGVIHRDLKPSNVMIGSFGEVQVVDWGLAKVLARGGVADERLHKKAARDVTMVSTVRSDEGSSHSVAGSVMGTPRYMSPEQARGRVDDLDERSDVFSLGAILCEILSGEPPYAGDTTTVLAAAARSELDAARAALDACDADSRLVDLCRRCLEPLPKDRPASVELVADEVASWLSEMEGLAHEAELAKVAAEADAVEQRRSRRQARRVGAAAVFVFSLAIGIVLVVSRGRAERDRARRNAVNAAVEDATRLRAAGAWEGALAAAERAVTLGAGDELIQEIRDEARAEAERARRQQEEAAFLEELQAIRADRTSGRTSVFTTDDDRVDAAFSAAFERRFGSVAASVERLAASRHAEAFAASLGFWCWVRKERLEGADWQELDAASRRVDPGHEDVRDALIADDAQQLLAIAEQHADELPVGLATQVALALAERVGHADAAVALLERLHRRAPGDLEVHSRLAYAARAAEDFDLSVRHAKVATTLAPGNAHTWGDLGWGYVARGDHGEARRAIERALELDPGHGCYYECIAKIAHEEGRLAETVEILEDGLRRVEGEQAVVLLAALGWYHVDARNVEAGLEVLERALRVDPDNVRCLWTLAAGLCMSGDLDGAMTAARRAVELDPEDPNAHHVLGTILTERGELDEALAVHRRAIELAPKNGAFHLDVAVVCEARGDQDGVLAACRVAADLSPDNAFVRWQLGKALLTRGDLAAARETLERAAELDPESAGIHVSLGEACRRSGDLAAAVRALRRAAELDPKDANAHNNLGGVLRERGDLDGAIGSIRRATELEPDSPVRRTNLGSALFESGRLDEARVQAREALELDPEDAQAHILLGTVLAAEGDRDGAFEVYRTASERDPTNAELQMHYGGALSNAGHLREAVRVLREAVRLDPRLAGGHEFLAITLSKLGDARGAIASAERALELDPALDGAQTTLGLGLLDLGRPDEAVEVLERVVELTPSSAEAHVNLASALRQRGHLGAALAACRRALELRPGFMPAQLNLGYVLRDQGDLQGALEAFGTACELEPANTLARTEYGGSLSNAGHLEEAVEVLQGAVRLAPNMAVPHLYLGITYIKLGAHEDAIVALRRVLELDPQNEFAKGNLLLVERELARTSLEPLVERLLDGEDVDVTPRERAQLGHLLFAEGEFALAAEMFARSFDEEEALPADRVAQHRYTAACAAALSGEVWHGLALEWLRAEFESIRERAAADPSMARLHLEHWRRDEHLAAVRDAESLDEGFAELWTEVEALLEQLGR